MNFVCNSICHVIHSWPIKNYLSDEDTHEFNESWELLKFWVLHGNCVICFCLFLYKLASNKPDNNWTHPVVQIQKVRKIRLFSINTYKSWGEILILKWKRPSVHALAMSSILQSLCTTDIIMIVMSQDIMMSCSDVMILYHRL